MNEILKLENLQKSFGTLRVLTDINLTVHQGEVVTVIGASGSGKSTMLRCINLLEEPDSGHIYFENADLTDLSTSINQLRQDIGMVFQSFNLVPNMNVLDNCTLAPMMIKHISRQEAEEVAKHGEEIKAHGAKYCDCPACQAAEAILSKKDDLLK